MASEAAEFFAQIPEDNIPPPPVSLGEPEVSTGEILAAFAPSFVSHDQSSTGSEDESAQQLTHELHAQKVNWWIDVDSSVQSNLTIKLGSYDDKPSIYNLSIDYGGWKWAVSRTFGDIKTFYVNLCRHDKTTFFRLSHHFPIVGTRREGTLKHAKNYNVRVAAFLVDIATKIDPLLYTPLLSLLRFEEGMETFIACVRRCQGAWRGYNSRRYNAPIMSYVHAKALVAGYDIDRRRYFHCWQLAIVCTKVLLSKDPREVHQEVLKLSALRVPAAMFTESAKALSLNGDVGTLSFHFQAGWMFRQQIDSFGFQGSGVQYAPGIDGASIALLADDPVSSIPMFGFDLVLANELLSEVVCEEVFFEALRSLSHAFPFDPMTDYYN